MVTTASAGSDSVYSMCRHQQLLIPSSLQFLPDIAACPDGFLMQTVRMAKMVFYLPVHLPPSAAGAWVAQAACLSQRAWKLAGEEGLACANYILIIGNVLANQALIAILEPSAPLCRIGIGVWVLWA